MLIKRTSISSNEAQPSVKQMAESLKKELGIEDESNSTSKNQKQNSRQTRNK